MSKPLSSILHPSRVDMSLEGTSKKRVLESIAKHIAADVPVLDGDELFRRLMARERLGSTGIGKGIAVPHCRLENCSGTIGSFFLLRDKISFDAVDDQPVDLIFALLVPEEEDDSHLQTLATIAQTFVEDDFLARLRHCTSNEELYQTLVSTN